MCPGFAHFLQLVLKLLFKFMFPLLFCFDLFLEKFLLSVGNKSHLGKQLGNQGLF